MAPIPICLRQSIRNLFVPPFTQKDLLIDQLNMPKTFILIVPNAIRA